MGFESAPSGESRENLSRILDDEVRGRLTMDLSALTENLAAKLGPKGEADDQRICLGDYEFHGPNYERLTTAIEASEEYKALVHEAKLLGREIWVSAEADDNPEHATPEFLGGDSGYGLDGMKTESHPTHARVWIEF
jgi:hypothetical protein